MPSDEHWVATEPSPRHVRAVVGGTVVADSERVLLLREAGHVGVYYFPMDDVRMDLLTPTDKQTRCPVKGQARYWSAGTVEDAAWSYTYPLPAVSSIAGHIAFFQERMDETWVDGEQVERPQTRWSRNRASAGR